MTLPHSSLPVEEEFWEELAQKVRADAAGPLSRYAAAPVPQTNWLSVVSRQAPWLLAASVVAMITLLATLPEARASRSAPAGLLERSLTPGERAAGLMAGSVAPSVAELLAEFLPVSSKEADQ